MNRVRYFHDFAVQAIGTVLLVNDLAPSALRGQRAEVLVRHLAALTPHLDTYLILHRAEDGIWDRVVTADGAFVCYSHVGATTRREALEWAQAAVVEREAVRA